jgi:hypothetical protein
MPCQYMVKKEMFIVCIFGFLILLLFNGMEETYNNVFKP